jgi:L-ascorbate metabolism protein UlaG (beta-lactamase superfamily)
MNPQDAVEALRLSGAGRAFGHHWGTFHLTNEAIEQPLQDLAAALATRDIPADHFPALHPGEVQVVT